MTKKELEKAADKYAWGKLEHQRLFNQDDCKYSYIDGATDICRKILEEVENYNSSCADIEEYGIYIKPLENIIKNLGVDIND